MYIRPDDLHYYAYVNESCLKAAPRAVMLDFHGLGFTGMKSEADGADVTLGGEGVVTVLPYYGAWNWMNFGAVALVDAVVDAVFEKLRLPDGLPVISTGGSMGGCSALMYPCYAHTTHRPVAAAANCPVCDLPFHATEREDLPRTMYSSFAHYDCGIDMALRLHSPLHRALAGELPRVPYLIVHGEADSMVNKAAHSDKLVQAMREQGYNVEYIGVPGMEHCAIGQFPEVEKRYWEFVKRFAR